MNWKHSFGLGLSLSCACTHDSEPTPDASPSPEPALYIRSRTGYCEFDIEGSGYGACGGVTMSEAPGAAFRGAFYDPVQAYSADEAMQQDSGEVHFLDLKDDVATFEVSYSAHSLETSPPFSFSVEGLIYVPWTQFLSKEYPHGDEPFYFVFGTMTVHFMAYTVECPLDDIPEYPPNGWAYSAEVAIDHVP